MIVVFKARRRRNLDSYLWAAGILLVGLVIVGFMALSTGDDPSVKQTEVVGTIVKLLNEPSTTGSGGFAPTDPERQ